jgi:hypothetical protein
MKNAIKKLLLLLPFLISAVMLKGQQDTTYWKNAFKSGVSLNQAAFSSNWIGGGVKSIGFNAYLNFKANYKRDNRSWDNEIDFLYGSINNEGQGLRKTNDKLYLDTKYGIGIGKNWDTFVSVNFLSQFANGYRYEKDGTGVERDTLISSFLAPAYLTIALGFEYHPVDYFKLRLSPLAPRFTFQTNSTVEANMEKNYGVEPGKNIRAEWFAFQLLADFDKDLSKNLNLKWRYIMYVNYEDISFDRIDHRLDLVLSAKVAKYIDVNLSLIGIYDKDQSDDIQFSEALGIGIVYSIQNYKEE